MKENDVELYCCFSLNLMHFLKDNGINYRVVGLNPNNHKKFWLYVVDENMKNVLKKWGNN